MLILTQIISFWKLAYLNLSAPLAAPRSGVSLSKLSEYNDYIRYLLAHMSEFSIEAQYVPQQEAAFETEF